MRSTRKARLDRTLSWEDVRASLWFWPCVAAIAALGLAFALVPLHLPAAHPVSAWLWPSDADAARALLQTVATSTMAATSLTFSLTVVALQLSSQQFSPRLLREFARDRFTQAVLAILVSTFVVSLVGLRGVTADGPLPTVLLAVVLLLGVASIITLLAFMGHLVRALRVDTMMAAVHHDTMATLHQVYPEHEGPTGEDWQPAEHGAVLELPATRSGFIKVVRPEPLLELASKRDLVIRLRVRPGDHVVRGTPLATAWSRGGGQLDHDALSDALLVSVELGYERTMEQDAAFGFRQLTDIGVKAISPGINDPVTAAHAIGYCADLLTVAFGRQLGERRVHDDRGTLRVVLPDRDPRYYLDIMCPPLRRYGSREPIVLAALLRMLRDAAVSARDEEQRSEIARQAGLVVDAMSGELLPDEADAVRDLAERVDAALAGRTLEAYDDRAGETRST